MNNTGTYKWCNVSKKLIKISDRVSVVGDAFSTTCEKVDAPYWDEHIDHKPVYITSRAQKSRILKRAGLIQRKFRGSSDLF